MTWDDEDATVVRKAQAQQGMDALLRLPQLTAQDREHLKALVESSHYRAVFGAKEQQ